MEKNKKNADFENELKNALLDMYDVRNKLSSAVIRTNNPEATSGLMKVLDIPKDNDGSIFTIGDCIEDVITFLEEQDTKD